MKVTFCLLLILLLSSCSCNKKESKMSERYFVEFLAYKENKPQGSPGHMFVEFWREQQGSSVSYGKFGFGPDDGYTADMFKNGIEWKGKFVKEPDNTPIDISYKKEVSKALFQKALGIKNDWMNISTFYKGGTRDCITFSLEVANSINLNDNRCICFPFSQVEYLKENNVSE